MAVTGLAVSVALLAAACSSTGGAGDSGEQTYKFSFGHIVPAETPTGMTDEWMAQEIEKRTGGRVTIEVGWSEGMGGGTELLDLTSAGALQMGSIVESYFPAQLPFLGGITDFWMVFDDIDTAVADASETGQTLLNEFEVFEQEATDNNLKLLYKHVVSPYMLIGNSSACTLEELNGVRIRTWGEAVPQAVQAAGAVPVSLTPAEIYEGLERGSVDMAFYDLAGIPALSLHETSGFLCTATLGSVPAFGIYMNLDTWNELPPDIQATFDEVAAEAWERDLANVQEAQSAARGVIEAAGVTVQEFAASDQQEWNDRIDFVDRWVTSFDDPQRAATAQQIRERLGSLASQ